MALDDLINQYRTKIEAGYKPQDYSASYQKIGQGIKKAYNAQYNQDVLNLKAQQKEADQDYRTQRTGLYVNARKNALLENEQLASMGLARGAAAAPSSGVSELARTQNDINMRNDVNAANVSQQRMRDDIARQIVTAGYTRDLNVAKEMADQELQKIQTRVSENQFSAGYNTQAYGALVNEYYQKIATEQQAQMIALQRQQNEIAQASMARNNAYSEVAQFGQVMTQNAANVLGLPIGTSIR